MVDVSRRSIPGLTGAAPLALAWSLVFGAAGLPFLFYFDVLTYLAGFFVVVLCAASINPTIRLLILLLLIPFSHAGIGVEGLGGFGLFDIYTILFLLFFLVRALTLGTGDVPYPKTFTLAGFLVVAYVPSLLNSTSPLQNARAFVQLLASIGTMAGVYYYVMKVQEEKTVERFLILLAVSAALVSLIGIYQRSTSSLVETALTGRVYFTLFGEVNYYASYLVTMVPLLLGFLLVADGFFKRNIYLAASLATIAAVLSTISRSALAVLLFVLFLFSVYSSFQKGWRRWIGIGILSSFFAIVGIGLMTGAGRAFVDLLALSQRVETVVTGQDASLEQRQNIFQVAYRMIESKTIVGVGFGSFEQTFDRFKETALSTGYARSAHNTFLRVLAETGIVGFVPTLIFFFSLLHALWKGIRKEPEESQKTMMFSVLLSLIAFLMMSLTLDQLFEPHFWVLAGLGLALKDRRARFLETKDVDNG